MDPNSIVLELLPLEAPVLAPGADALTRASPARIGS